MLSPAPTIDGSSILNDTQNGRFLVPRRAFTDRRIFEREYASIFDRCWLYLGHASELPEPGSFLTRRVARRPILFTRDKAGEFHALLNTCPHRGAMVCRERNGKSPAFMCMYHGWTFGSDGHLMALPGSSGYPAGFKTDPQKQMVHVPRLGRHGDFFFISFAHDGEDLATYLADAGDYLNLVAEHSESGMTVVGGRNITMRGFTVADTDSAGVYVATEGDPYFTRTVENVSISDGTVTGANRNAGIVQGAVLVAVENPGTAVRNVSISDIRIAATPPSAERNVAIYTETGTLQDVRISRISLDNSTLPAFFTNADTESFAVTSWTAGGKPIAVS